MHKLLKRFRLFLIVKRFKYTVGGSYEKNFEFKRNVDWGYAGRIYSRWRKKGCSIIWKFSSSFSKGKKSRESRDRQWWRKWSWTSFLWIAREKYGGCGSNRQFFCCTNPRNRFGSNQTSGSGCGCNLSFWKLCGWCPKFWHGCWTSRDGRY